MEKKDYYTVSIMVKDPKGNNIKEVLVPINKLFPNAVEELLSTLPEDSEYERQKEEERLVAEENARIAEENRIRAEQQKREAREAWIAEQMRLKAEGKEYIDPISMRRMKNGVPQTVICTEMHRQGLLSDELFEADKIFGKEIKKYDRSLYDGYLLWAVPFVKFIQDKPTFTKFSYQICFKHWAEYMGYMVGVRKKLNLYGYMMHRGLSLISRITYFFNRLFTSKSNIYPNNPCGY